jgi:Kdo2-lipid IVA lauroyltransferase/acyltransferase
MVWPDRKKDKGEEVNRLTRAWSRVVERYVRTFPDQWVWMHRRWKTEAPKLESLAPEMSQEEIGGPVRV